MLKPFKLSLWIVVVLSLILAACKTVDIGDIYQNIPIGVGSPETLTDTEIIQGLKEALRIGTNNAVTLVSRLNGYYQNPTIRIPLPDSVRKTEDLLRSAGFGSTVDEFELSMNRAAETAAPAAKSLFWDAVRKITISDARRILKGPDDAATLYFKRKTEARLLAAFKPVVHQSMQEVGVTRTYQQLYDRYRRLPFLGDWDLDLDQYVTSRAIDGLFTMLAKEEARIRQDPAARVTELLRKVFGST